MELDEILKKHYDIKLGGNPFVKGSTYYINDLAKVDILNWVKEKMPRANKPLSSPNGWNKLQWLQKGRSLYYQQALKNLGIK